MRVTDINSISYEEIKSFLESYIKSLPEYSDRWREFYEGGAGQTVLNVGAGISAFLAFSAYMNRKNSYLDYGVLSSSIVSIATSNGFIYNRSCCPRLRITFTSTSNFVISKETSIGTYKSFDLSLFEDTTINVGENTIEVGIGDWNTSSLTISDSSEFFGFMIESDIDNNYFNLSLNDKPLLTTLYPESMDENNVLIRSYSNGVYIISGNDIIGKRLNPSDVIKLDYISPAKKLDNAITSDKNISLILDNYTITKVETIDYGSDPDTDNKLVTLSPGYKFSQRVIMAIGDFKYVGGAYQGLVSCNATATSNKCCSVNVAYLRQDELLFTKDQKTEFLSYLKSHSIVGLSFILIDPEPINVDIELKILLESASVDSSAIKEKILNIFQIMCLNLGGIFSPGKILAESIEGVSRIYLSKPLKDKQANYNQYFRINSLNISFETNELKLLQAGTNIDDGYSE